MLPRKSQRFAVQLSASFSGDEISGDGTLLNVSMEGCKIVSETELNPTHYVSLRIEIPPNPTPLVVKLAAVRWSSGNQFGMDFIQMDEKEQERLRQFVKTLEEHPVV